jgi:hypothetical protein
LCWICCCGLISELVCHLEHCIIGKSISNQRQKNFRKETSSIFGYSTYKWNIEILIEWHISCCSNYLALWQEKGTGENCSKPSWELASFQNVICRQAHWLALTAVVCSKNYSAMRSIHPFEYLYIIQAMYEGTSIVEVSLSAENPGFSLEYSRTRARSRPVL